MDVGNWVVVRPNLLSGSYLLGSYGPMLFSPEMVPMPDWTPCPVRILTKRKTRSTEMDNGIYVKIHIYIPQISCSSGVWAARVYLEMQVPSGCCLKHQEKQYETYTVLCRQTLDELVSGSSKEVFSTLVSSMSTANGPVGSMFSKGDPVSHSGVQQSCTSSSVSKSTGHLDPNFGASPCYDAFVLVILVLPFTSTTQ
ncbi:hypothetical protein BC332_15676 [Capsicum chinense]|nr:hypothetical protein BC332_15676 [Capsicum chinense]